MWSFRFQVSDDLNFFFQPISLRFRNFRTCICRILLSYPTTFRFLLHCGLHFEIPLLLLFSMVTLIPFHCYFDSIPARMVFPPPTVANCTPPSTNGGSMVPTSERSILNPATVRWRKQTGTRRCMRDVRKSFCKTWIFTSMKISG